MARSSRRLLRSGLLVGALVLLVLHSGGDIGLPSPVRSFVPAVSSRGPRFVPAFPGALPRGLTRGAQGCVGGADWFARRRAAMGPPPEPRVSMSAAQVRANSRVLILSSDTRPLARSWGNRSYHSLTMTLNRHYAASRGYDFAFVRTFMSSRPSGPNENERDAACFHLAFKLWRVHNWCKVLMLWAASGGARDASGAPLYDLVVYLDSDAAVLDVSSDLSEAWNPSAGAIEFGTPFCALQPHAMAGGAGGALRVIKGKGGGELPQSGDGQDTAAAAAAPVAPTTTTLDSCNVHNDTGPLLLFYSDNVPDEVGSPNLGFSVMRHTRRARALLRDWWDFDEHRYAVHAFHEQTGMWKLMNPPRQWGGGVTVTAARWAPDGAARFVRHVNSEERIERTATVLRIEKFSSLLRVAGLTERDYEDSIRDAIDSCQVVDLDVLDVARDMAADMSPRSVT